MFVGLLVVTLVVAFGSGQEVTSCTGTECTEGKTCILYQTATAMIPFCIDAKQYDHMCGDLYCVGDCVLTTTGAGACRDYNDGGEVCQPMECDKVCDYGFKHGSDGCPMCDCNDPPPEIVNQEENPDEKSAPPVEALEELCPEVRPDSNADCADLCQPGACPDREACCSNGCGHVCTPISQLCEFVECDTDCEYGNVWTDDGCMTCDCNPEPICPEIHCYEDCVDGFVIRDGCETCDCNPGIHELGQCPDGSHPYATLDGDMAYCDEKESCPPTHECTRDPSGAYAYCCLRSDMPPPEHCDGDVCEEQCEFGYHMREDGCLTCECIPPPEHCDGDVCEEQCEFGFEMREDGCLTCECRPPPPPCPDFGKCDLKCERYVITEDGCLLCECDPMVLCDEIRCDVKCEFGLKMGPFGCPICECQEAVPCADEICEMHCEFGLKSNSDGCPMCECNMPEPICSTKPCIPCQEGFLMATTIDTSGCETCDCIPDQNVKPICPDGTDAYGEGGQVLFCDEEGQGCPETHECMNGYCCGGSDLPPPPPVPCEDTGCKLECSAGFKTAADGCMMCECNTAPVIQLNDEQKVMVMSLVTSLVTQLENGMGMNEMFQWLGEFFTMFGSVKR